MPDPENPRVVRCHGAGCERTLATVMQGPYDQAGREIRALVLARDVRKRAPGEYVVAADAPPREEVLGRRIAVGAEAVWAVAGHECRARLAPRSARLTLRCPSCADTIQIDMRTRLSPLPDGGRPAVSATVSLLDVAEPTAALLGVGRSSQ